MTCIIKCIVEHIRNVPEIPRDNISKLYDDSVLIKFSLVDEYGEIVKNYLDELYNSDSSNETLISNLQSS